MTDFNKFTDWYYKMEYEGGVEAMLDYSGSRHDTGDEQLNTLLKEAYRALTDVRNRISDLEPDLLEEAE